MSKEEFVQHVSRLAELFYEKVQEIARFLMEQFRKAWNWIVEHHKALVHVRERKQGPFYKREFHNHKRGQQFHMQHQVLNRKPKYVFARTNL